MATELLDGLSGAQIDAVTTAAAPLAVIAGPGSGKTRVLTHRVAHRIAVGDADPAHILVLTFSRRAALELYGRLGRLGFPAGARDGGVWAGTFHAVAWAQLSRHRSERGLPPLAILAHPARLLAEGLARELGRDPTAAELASLSKEMTWARLQEVGPTAYAAAAAGGRRRGGLAPEVVSTAWSAYERSKRDRRVLDLDDLLEVCARLLTTDPEAAQAAQWRHRHLFVDEYQDLNPAHRRLLHAWVAGRPDICIVGDPDQSVYGFNGASPDLFDRVLTDWPGVEVIRLTENHRSTPEVVALANAVRPAREHASFRSTRSPGPLPTLIEFADDRTESRHVAAELARHRGPRGSWTGLAVLARTNARLRLVAAALDVAGVPWHLRDPRPVGDRPAVRAWVRALPDRAPVADLHEIVAPGPDSRPGDGPDREAFLAALSDFEASAPAGSVRDFVSWLAATGVTAEEPPGVGVDLATFHRAKGLEWPAVWIVGVEEGLVPIAGGAAALAEERRLLYVALTRASDTVTVSWTRRRTVANGSTVDCQPSRWVEPLLTARTALAAVARPEEQQVRLAALRRALSPPPSHARRAALQRWRELRARAARIPPGAVLSDRILDELAAVTVRSEQDVTRVAASAGRRAQLWAPEVLRVLEAAQ